MNMAALDGARGRVRLASRRRRKGRSDKTGTSTLAESARYSTQTNTQTFHTNRCHCPSPPSRQPGVYATLRVTLRTRTSAHHGAIFTRDPAKVVVLTRGESVGLAYANSAAFISVLASIVILVLIARRIRKDGDWESLDVCVIALFAAEMIQGISHVMDLKWIVQGGLETGSFCTAQGSMQQLGEVSVALATLTITVQTFLIIWRLKPLSRAVTLRIIALELIFVVLMVGIGFGIHTHPPKEYYAVPTYWCWIGSGFSSLQIGLEYLWFWVTLFISAILYVLVFLLYLGVFTTGDRWYSPRINIRSNATHAVNGAGHTSSLAIPSSAAQVISGKNQLLWSTLLYPVLYCILILPISVIRFMTFHNRKIHNQAAANIAVSAVFTLSGVLNAILYIGTRRNFFQVDERRTPQAPEVKVTTPAEV